MRKNLYLILTILSAVNVVYTFFSDATNGDFFGFQVDIWTYRLVWVLFTALFFKTYFNLRKASTEK
jgi:hypothetical protein